MPQGQPMTRPEMEAVIDSGGAVIHDGRIYTKKDRLPTALDLAGDDPAKRAAAVGDIDAQIAALQARRDAVEPGTIDSGPTPVAPAPTTKAESRPPGKPKDDDDRSPVGPGKR